MVKYLVYGVVNATKLIGTYEADSEEEAIEKANKDKNADWNCSVCHQCSENINVGEIYEIMAEEM